MEEIVTSARMKEIEKEAFEKGLPYIDMMENAGKSAAEEIIENYNPKDKIVVIATGKGNNGGDGYVVARYLKKIGAYVVVIMAEGKPVTPDAITNFQKCQSEDIEILQYQPIISDILFDGADLIVDAIYGAGFHGEFSPSVLPVAKIINQVDGKVISLDLPSGLNADTGEIAENAVKADSTIVFARLKKGQVTISGLKQCGKISLKDIGI